MSTPEVDVLVVGAGVVGAALIRELSRYELKLLLVEKEVDVSFGTSKANSGIVHSGIHDQTGTLKAQLCVRGCQLFPELAAELGFLYKQNGAVVVARSREELVKLEKLAENGRANGVKGLSLLSREELRRLEPNLSAELAGGLLAPSGGIVVPFDLVFALTENAVANGAKLLVGTEVLGIKEEKDGFLVRTNRQPIRAKVIVNAAGLYGGEVAAMIGDHSIQLYARKGEEYLFDRKLEGLVRRTVFPLPSAISKGILVIPTVDGNIMIGPTAHRVDNDDDLGTSLAGWNEIYTEARKLVPALQPADLITAFAGLRAVGTTGDFLIAPSHVSPRFINAAGIESPGLTAAPAIAEYIVELIKDSGLKLRRKREFNPIRSVVRLRDLNPREQAALMQKDPAYGQIICRCEMVSAGEIRDAIRRGATTLDGVKLRTRSGMGRCQGGFCTPKIIRLLSDELGLPPERISKNGPGSELLFGRLREDQEETAKEEKQHA
ncbi:MAG: NAD(P)/FAD-dependent oxidoreductase [Firmicutes bacterium]|nr:NAD(P)/FAD-dependent oxidoreductase [Bacillota bacterium]